MAFTYGGNPATSELDALRFAIGDTDATSPLLQDAEIQYIIDNYSGNAKMAALFRQAATMISIRPTKRSLGPQSEDTSRRQEYFSRLADKYEKQALNSGVPPLPSYQADPVFEKGMMTPDV